jgi:FAD synthase
MKIDIVELLRGEKRFDSVDELRRQIADDIRRSQDILKT